MPDTFTLPNWSELQSYRGRNPQWISLYASAVLEDERFVSLPEVQRLSLVLIWALATRFRQRDGEGWGEPVLPWNPQFLAQRVGMKTKPDLGRMAELGLILPDSVVSQVSAVRSTVVRRDPWKLESFDWPDGVPSTPGIRAALQSWLEGRKVQGRKAYKTNRWISGAWDDCGESEKGLVAGINTSLAKEYVGIAPSTQGRLPPGPRRIDIGTDEQRKQYADLD